MRVKRFLVAALMAAPLMALPLAAAPGTSAPGAPAPIATEQVAGNMLTMQPQVEYTRATLTIRGREDVRIVREFGPGGAISASLVTAEGATLPDGLYEYTLSFSFGDEQGEMSEMRREKLEAQRPSSMNGIFFVQDGTAISRGERRAALATQRSELQAAAAPGGPGTEALNVDDSVYIQDTAGDDVTILLMGGAVGTWNIYNDADVFRISPFGPAGPQVAIDAQGLGVGTTNPGQELHIVGGSDINIRLEDGDSGDRFDIELDDNTTVPSEFQIEDSGGTEIFALDDGVPANSLVIRVPGRVGFGVDQPEGDMHLNNLDSAGDTVFKIASPGQGSWNLGMRAANGVFTFNKVGTPQEFSVREANHAIATLDVAGHVRGTSFKSTSSRALKTGFDALDPTEVLAKVAEMPVTSWRYKTEDEGVRHFGPVAEDFQRLFGLGDGKTISTVDADGVLMAAVQGLNAKVKARDAEIDALKARLQAIEEQLAQRTP